MLKGLQQQHKLFSFAAAAAASLKSLRVFVPLRLRVKQLGS